MYVFKDKFLGSLPFSINCNTDLYLLIHIPHFHLIRGEDPTKICKARVMLLDIIRNLLEIN